jgi:hypothetical protein
MSLACSPLSSAIGVHATPAVLARLVESLLMGAMNQSDHQGIQLSQDLRNLKSKELLLPVPTSKLSFLPLTPGFLRPRPAVSDDIGDLEDHSSPHLPRSG